MAIAGNEEGVQNHGMNVRSWQDADPLSGILAGLNVGVILPVAVGSAEMPYAAHRVLRALPLDLQLRIVSIGKDERSPLSKH